MRFHLVGIEPELAVYASPLNFDPDAPFFPISDPPEYAADLAAQIGLYYTTGMVEDHAGLNNERISEETFLDQCSIAWRDRETMMLHELESFRSGLFYCLFDTPDRIQHLFWRFREPGHPANHGRIPSPDFAQVIDDAYRRCDAIVGKALEYSDDQTLLIALFRPRIQQLQARRSCEQVAARQRISGAEPGVRPGEAAGDLLRHVDWGRTPHMPLGSVEST